MTVLDASDGYCQDDTTDDFVMYGLLVMTERHRLGTKRTKVNAECTSRHASQHVISTQELNACFTQRQDAQEASDG